MGWNIWKELDGDGVKLARIFGLNYCGIFGWSGRVYEFGVICERSLQVREQNHKIHRMTRK
jgi:hypothetical protein